MKENGIEFLTLLHPVVPMRCSDNECSFTINNFIGTRISTVLSHTFFVSIICQHLDAGNVNIVIN